MQVEPASISPDHIRLFNAYHADMTDRREWPEHQVIADEYFQSFLAGHWEFAYEFRYFRGDKLVGLGLVDVLPEALSSVYFFHDPSWRSDGPGTFSIQKEIEFAKNHGIDHVYLGYWIEACPSMTYKARFGPHEVLDDYVEDTDQPSWNLPVIQAPSGQN